MSWSPYKLCQNEKIWINHSIIKKNDIGLLPKLSQKGKDGLKSSSYIKWHRTMSNEKDKSKSF